MDWKNRLAAVALWLFTRVAIPFGAGVSGIIVALGGDAINFASKDRELDIEMVKIALNMLADPKILSDEREGQRNYALSLLQKFSGVEIDESDKDSWISYGLNMQFSNAEDACARASSEFMENTNEENFSKFWILGCATHIKYEEYKEFEREFYGPPVTLADTMKKFEFTPEEEKKISELVSKAKEIGKKEFIEGMNYSIQQRVRNSELRNEIMTRPLPKIAENPSIDR